MADLEPKTASVGTETSMTAATPAHHDSVTEAPRPPGWMYKKLPKFGWYASPKVQLGMVAFVCFLCPGMFNALSGLGGGGKADPSLADDMVRSCSSAVLACSALEIGRTDLDFAEYRSLQYLCRRRFLRGHLCQPHGCASCLVDWWHWLLHLLD